MQLPTVPLDPRFRDDEIDEGPFRLIGWLPERSNHVPGLERDDRLARISLGTTLPGPEFVAHHVASVSRDGRSVLDAADERLAWIRAFADQPPEPDRVREFYAEGAETFVRLDALVDYLATADMALITLLQAERNLWRT